MSNPHANTKRVLSVFVEVELEHTFHNFQERPSAENFNALQNAMYVYQYQRGLHGAKLDEIADAMMVCPIGEIIPRLMVHMRKDFGELVPAKTK